MTDGATTLYRVFTHGGTLLYVGISKSMFTRLAAHAKESKWFGKGDVITTEHWPSREEALRAEAAAIAAERPAFNVQVLPGYAEDWERDENLHRCWSLHKFRDTFDGRMEVLRCARWKGHEPSPFQVPHENDIWAVSWSDEDAWNFDEEFPPTAEELLAKERWDRYDRIKNRRVVLTYSCFECGARVGQWCNNAEGYVHTRRDPTWDRWLFPPARRRDAA